MTATKQVSVDRRDFVCGGGGAVLNTMLAALLGDAKPARAAPIFGPVPEVDRVTVSVIVDNYQFAVAPNAKVGSVDIRRFGWGLSDKPPSKTLISEFGLSLHVESQRGVEQRRVLVDFGFTPGLLAPDTDVVLRSVLPAILDARDLGFLPTSRSSEGPAAFEPRVLAESTQPGSQRLSGLLCLVVHGRIRACTRGEGRPRPRVDPARGRIQRRWQGCRSTRYRGNVPSR